MSAESVAHRPGGIRALSVVGLRRNCCHAWRLRNTVRLRELPVRGKAQASHRSSGRAENAASLETGRPAIRAVELHRTATPQVQTHGLFTPGVDSASTSLGDAAQARPDVLSVAPLLAEIIRRLHADNTLNDLWFSESIFEPHRIRISGKIADAPQRPTLHCMKSQKRWRNTVSSVYQLFATEKSLESLVGRTSCKRSQRAGASWMFHCPTPRYAKSF